MIKAVIFDMGGVILRTVDPGKREAMAARLGINRRELEKVLFQSPTSIQSEIGALSVEEHWNSVLAQFQVPPDSYMQLSTEFFAGDEIDQELLVYIQLLKEKYKVGLLSNAWMGTRETLGRRFDFPDMFDISVFSAEVGIRKPDARIYQLILEKLQAAPQEAIFVDDLPENVAGAVALGIRAVQFKDRQQAIQDINQLLAD